LHQNGERFLEPYACSLRGDAEDLAAVSVREASCKKNDERGSALGAIE